MVSYYNLPYTQKPNLAYNGQWQWTTNYPAPPNHQFLSEMESPHTHHQMYYNPHHPMFHTSTPAGGSSGEWHSPTHTDNFAQSAAASAHQMHHVLNGAGGGGISNSSASSGSTGSASAGPISGTNTNLNDSTPITEGLPSPPITIAGSEISSPGVPASSSSPHHLPHHLNNSNNNNNNSPSAIDINRTSPVKAQYYDWMKKYPTQPAPGTYTDADQRCTASHLEDFPELSDFSGKTRTKDKYRVVYTDFQRLELEKEYCTSRYITIRRKTELAQSLTLSERQVKIWFQNRRAKERKQNKKTNDPITGPMGNSIQHNEYINIMEAKPKLEPGLHLQHSLHAMSSMAHMMHHPLHGHHPLAAVSAAAVAHSHPLHHQTQMTTSSSSGVGSLAM